MVAGSLKEKKDYYYMVLELRDQNGKRKQKTISTGLKVKGNKKRAEAMLHEHRSMYTNETKKNKTEDVLFEDFMAMWLETKKHSIRLTTYGSYQIAVHAKIIPYFEGRNITLSNLAAKDLQNFYEHLLKTISPSSVKRVYANINSALKFAIKQDYVATNVNEKTEIPRNNQYVAEYYSTEEINRLFEISENTIYEFPVLFGLFYGMRRSEAIGMRWDAISWDNNTLTIDHTVTTATVNNKRQLIISDTTKNKSSRRTLPLVPFVREKLLSLKEKQEANKKLCGNSYNRTYIDYICVDTVGDIINPDYITQSFKDFLIKNDLKPVRYHDLRHSCASAMLSVGVPMKQIQDWLGHSDFGTTANIYAHLQSDSKVASAQALEALLNV